MAPTATQMAGAAAGSGGGSGQFASPLPQDRLIRRETALGFVRELVPPQDHIGLTQIAPFLEVQTDDVMWSYILGGASFLAPARAQDAESALYNRDDIFGTEGRASVIDWALKNHYTASDVNSWRDWLKIQQLVRDEANLPLTAANGLADFRNKMIRDTTIRRRALDDRLEWLCLTPLGDGTMAYNDGKIKWSVDYGRPTAQNMTPGSTVTSTDGGTLTLAAGSWIKSDGSGDPIGDLINMQTWAYDTYGVHLTRAIASRKILSKLWASSKFAARSGFVLGTGNTATDIKYLVSGWSPQAAQALIEAETGIKFIEYDSVYRTRAVGSLTTVNNRFLAQNKVILMPDDNELEGLDDTGIGFGKMLSSPHPAGNWTSGFYEWEKEYGVDPWGYDAGNGIKAFPVYLHMDKTFSYTISALDGSV